MLSFKVSELKQNKKDIYHKSSAFAYYIFLRGTSVSCNHFDTAINVLNREILSSQESSLMEKGTILIPSVRCLQSGENFLLIGKTFTL